MANIVRKDIDDLITHLHLTIEPEDYKKKYDAELAKYSQQATMKGFRKGKTPKSVIRKMYGKGILQELVSDVFQEKLSTYLKEEMDNVILRPLLAEGQQPFLFDPKNLDSYEYVIEVARAAEFDIKGAQETDVYKRYVIEEINDEKVSEELEIERKRAGERIEIEEDIQKNDMVKLRVRQLENGEVKENGVDNDFSVLVSESLTDELRELLLAKKKGETFEFSPANIEKEASEEFIRNHFLGEGRKKDSDEEDFEQHDDYDSETDTGKTLEQSEEDVVNEEESMVEVNQLFHFEVLEVMRIELAEMNEEFFKELYGDSVTTEEEARVFIKEQLLKIYNQRSGQILQNEVLEKVLHENVLELPEKFLRRWLKKTNTEATDETVEGQLEEFKKSVSWQTVRDRIIREHEIEVTQEEVIDRAYNQISSYFGGGQADPQMMQNIVRNMLKDEKFVQEMSDRAATEKVAQVLAEKMVKTEDEVVTTDAFEQIMKDYEQAQEEKETERIAAQRAAMAVQEAEIEEVDAETENATIEMEATKENEE